MIGFVLKDIRYKYFYKQLYYLGSSRIKEVCSVSNN